MQQAGQAQPKPGRPVRPHVQPCAALVTLPGHATVPPHPEPYPHVACFEGEQMLHAGAADGASSSGSAADAKSTGGLASGLRASAAAAAGGLAALARRATRGSKAAAEQEQLRAAAEEAAAALKARADAVLLAAYTATRNAAGLTDSLWSVLFPGMGGPPPLAPGAAQITASAPDAAAPAAPAGQADPMEGASFGVASPIDTRLLAEGGAQQKEVFNRLMAARLGNPAELGQYTAVMDAVAINRAGNFTCPIRTGGLFLGNIGPGTEPCPAPSPPKPPASAAPAGAQPRVPGEASASDEAVRTYLQVCGW